MNERKLQVGKIVDEGLCELADKIDFEDEEHLKEFLAATLAFTAKAITEIDGKEMTASNLRKLADIIEKNEAEL